jgi:hypothetical protein
MSVCKIDELIWRALVDADFCAGLLNGRRQELVDGLGLSDEDRRAVLAVQADTLEAFAGALCQAGVCPIGANFKETEAPRIGSRATPDGLRQPPHGLGASPDRSTAVKTAGNGA